MASAVSGSPLAQAARPRSSARQRRAGMGRRTAKARHEQDGAPRAIVSPGLGGIHPGVAKKDAKGDAKKNPNDRLICKNRKASHRFELGERFEAGLVLLGTEVK